MKRRDISYWLVGMALIVSLLASSCVYVDTQPGQTEPVPAPAPEPAPAAAPPAISVPASSPDYVLPPAVVQPALPDFISVVAKVRPSVVSINTEVVTFDIFNRPLTQKGSGSGWIMDPNGYIATNNHVIEGAKSITVTLSNDTALPAAVVGTDPLNDIAVIKVESSNLTAVQIGDSAKLRIGEWVLAIGNALGMGISAKQGIVSRLGVSIPVDSGQTLYDLVETSAAINPGNSGGPLLNMAGEVIGITSLKLSAVGVEGLGYAISSNTARPIIEELIQKKYVTRPWLGVVLQTVNQWLALRYSMSVQKGAFITEIARGSPADKAGLKAGDVITGLNDKDVNSADDLIRSIHAGKNGDTVRITYWRGNQKNTVSAVLAESPPPSK